MPFKKIIKEPKRKTIQEMVAEQKEFEKSLPKEDRLVLKWLDKKNGFPKLPVRD